MHALQETIRPSADLRNHYSEISKQCREENEAVIITVSGVIPFFLMLNFISLPSTIEKQKSS